MSNLLKYFRKAHGSITLQCCYDHESVPYSSKDNESVNDTKLPMLAEVAAIDGVYIYIYQTLLSKATYSAFRLYIFLSVHVFPGNRTHNLCAANAML